MSHRTMGGLLAGVLSGLLAAGGAGAEDRGAYLAAIMDCGGCHTPGYLRGAPEMDRFLGGSDVGFMIPGSGVVYPPNLTSDEVTGIGAWSEKQLVDAIRTGMRPDGRQLLPIMPYMHYAKLTDEDASALARYLKTVPAISNKVPELAAEGQTPPLPYLTLVAP